MKQKNKVVKDNIKRLSNERPKKDYNWYELMAARSLYADFKDFNVSRFHDESLTVKLYSHKDNYGDFTSITDKELIEEALYVYIKYLESQDDMKRSKPMKDWNVQHKDEDKQARIGRNYHG